ncbi:MAG: PilZ domain-containing protein [Aquabacterium sp.]|nr:PilZ domain-containing protein [Aquabacterium sp.]
MPNPFEAFEEPQPGAAESGASGADRRAAVRRPLRAQAMVLLPGLPGRPCKTVDISESGICVTMAEALASGTQCLVGFELPDRQGNRKRHQARARVVHSVLASNSDGFKVGMQFGEVADAALLAIQAYVRE